jgi:hypothetical protein
MSTFKRSIISTFLSRPVYMLALNTTNVRCRAVCVGTHFISMAATPKQASCGTPARCATLRRVCRSLQQNLVNQYCRTYQMHVVVVGRYELSFGAASLLLRI